MCPHPNTPPEDLAAYFWAHVDQSGGPDACWPWRLARDKDGYGLVHYPRQMRRCHRLALELTSGPIPTGLWALHTCNNPPCCNPRHLYAGDGTANAQDRERAGRGHPVRGEAHPLALLTAQDVREIRRRYAAGGITQEALGIQVGVSSKTIHKIVNRLRWRHIE